MVKYSHVCLDVETTGLDPEKSEVVEITAIEFNMSGVIGETMTFLCKPIAGFISAEISAINGITYDMVSDKPGYLTGRIREKIAEFVGKRTAVGHNIEEFDSKFIKFTPVSMEDTLKMSRKRFPGRSNKLKTACSRLNIEWDEQKAHRSEYDVQKTIQLYLKLKDFEEKSAERTREAPIFSSAINDQVEKINNPGIIGVIPSENDKKLIATQAYSYSRINLFHQCPFKWFMQYIKGVKQPDEDYLIVGKALHRIADKSGWWCFRELFANKFVIFAKKSGIEVKESEWDSVVAYYNEPASMHNLGRYVFEHVEFAKSKFNVGGLYALIIQINASAKGESYETPSMPSMDAYERIIQDTVNELRVTDPDMKTDIRRLAERFFRNGNFSLLPGDVVLTEKRMAFDKNWKMLSDFFAGDAYFRGIIDAIYFFGRTVLIKDYKTSRTMEKESNMSENMQLLSYAFMVYKFIPRTSYDKIVIQIDYLRYGKTIELIIDDIDYFVEKVSKWIESSVQEIESEMLKTDGTAFAPVRNEYCHTCHVGGDGKCPLFNKSLINNIEDPFNFVIDNIDDCVKAWKRVEVNKSENSRLAKLCKSFVNECESSVIIDKNATLDFYTSKKREYDTVKSVQLLLKKGMPIETILSFMSFPESQFQKFLEYKELKLTDEEVAEISEEKTRTEFDAYTPEEVKKKEFLNT